MGLIKAVKNSVGGIFADQWREFFCCDALPADVLIRRGQKRDSRGNNKGDSNIITNGSILTVADGQCAIIVDQGRVVEICAEPGEFTYDTSAEPSVFCGDLAETVMQSFMAMGRRFSFGGEPARDQRIYYCNTKELPGNKYGTPSPVPFRVVDERAGIDIDISIRCFGEYSYKLVDPILFYTNVCGNVAYEYRRSDLDGQLRSELLTALQPAFARISAMGVRYSALMAHTSEIRDALKIELSADWGGTRGIEICGFGISSMKASEEDEQMLKDLQRNAAFMDPSRAAAHLVGAQANAMQEAAKNSAGAMTGFMGMNMAAQNGGMNAGELFAMGQKQAAAPAPNSWKCSCGAENTGKFCAECGKAKPVQGWICSCGTISKGKFCPECGKAKPAGEPLYQCDKCGWQPEDPKNPPKFCPQCGDPFDDHDVK